MKKSLINFIGIAIVTILISETSLIILSVVIPKFDMILSLEQPSIPDERLGRIPNPRYPGHDKKGYRNNYVPMDVLVIAMGDSQTYGLGVNAEEAWPQQLGSLGKIRTYNMAHGGYGPTHSLVLFDEALDMKPKLIIEALYIGNDLYDSYNHVYVERQFPYLKNQDKNVARNLIDLEKTDPYLKKIELTLGLKGSRRNKAILAIDKFMSLHSRTYVLLKNVYYNLKHPYIKKDMNIEKFYCKNIHTVFMPRYHAIGMNIKDPRIEEGLRISLESIRLMSEKAKKSNIKFMVVLIPTKEMVFKDMAAAHGIKISDDYAASIKNERVIFQRIEEALNREKIIFLDTLPYLKKVLADNAQPYPQ